MLLLYEVCEILAENNLNSNLTFPSGNGFYIDEQDGVPGYNTDPERGADTFHPFINLPSVFLNIGSQSANAFTITINRDIKSGFLLIDTAKYGGGSGLRTANITLSNGTLTKVLESEYGGGSLNIAYLTQVIYKIENVQTGAILSVSGLADIVYHGVCNCRIIC